MKRAGLVVAGLALSGCAAHGLQKPESYVFAAGVATLATPADVRLVNVRNRTTDNGPVLCAEPSPDVAKALSTLSQLQGQGGNGTINVGLGGGSSTAETVSLLAGRTAAVVALRDGLYRACEAYANGILPKAAYGLILSQYGDVLVTLALGEAASGASGVGQPLLGGAPVAPQLQISFANGSPGSATGAGAPGASAPGGSPPPTATGTGSSPPGGSPPPSGMAPAAPSGQTQSPAPAAPGPTGSMTTGGGAAAPSAAPVTPPNASAAAATAAIASTYFASFDNRQQEALVTACVVYDRDRDILKSGVGADPDASGKKSLGRTTMDDICAMTPKLMRAQADIVREGRENGYAVALLQAQAQLLQAQAELAKAQAPSKPTPNPATHKKTLHSESGKKLGRPAKH